MSNIDVCFGVQLTTKDHAGEISWSFGGCQSEFSPTTSAYASDTIYNQTCCFSTSRFSWVYELKCIDSFGDGWHHSFITVNGVNYCEDFLDGYETSAYIEANPSKYFTTVVYSLVIISVE